MSKLTNVTPAILKMRDRDATIPLVSEVQAPELMAEWQATTELKMPVGDHRIHISSTLCSAT